LVAPGEVLVLGGAGGRLAAFRLGAVRLGAFGRGGIDEVFGGSLVRTLRVESSGGAGGGITDLSVETPPLFFSLRGRPSPGVPGVPNVIVATGGGSSSS